MKTPGKRIRHIPRATLSSLALVVLSCNGAWATSPDDPAARTGEDCQAVPVLAEFSRLFASAKFSHAVYERFTSSDLGFGDAGADSLLLEFFGPGYGSSGTFNLGQGLNGNYSTCWHCFLVFEGIDPNTTNSEKQFFPSAGTIGIDPSTPAGSDPILVRLQGVRVIEVTIDPNTYVSTPVVGGDCYDLIDEIVFANGFEQIAPTGPD